MDDPSQIGPGMAVAILTTLYGALIANVVALPINDKLSLRNQEETLTKSMIIEGILGVARGENPRMLEEILKTFLPGKKRALSQQK
jgi:chemotaxis protein MotA